MAGWRVTEEAVRALKSLSIEIKGKVEEIERNINDLHTVYEELQVGLGAHSIDIARILNDVDSTSKIAISQCKALRVKLERSALLRQRHIDSNGYGAGSGSKLDGDGHEIAAVLGRMYDSNYRKRRTPKETARTGASIGTWRDGVFCPADSYIPTNYNPEKRSFQQIRDSLQEKYGIEFAGVPYVNGYADFSSVAVARVNLADVIESRVAEDREAYTLDEDEGKGIDFEKLLSERGKNFDCADRLAAEKHIPIPDLPKDYTAADLKKWRKEQKFTWDESYDGGYMLVPSVIHGNIPHTGLVGIGTHGSQIEKEFEDRHSHEKGNREESGFVSDSDAVISYDELLQRKRSAK